MDRIPSTEAKNRFGQLLETVHWGPVGISKKGRTVAVLLSVSTYEEMLRKADAPTDPPAITGILDWLDRHPPMGAAIDETDYARHLDENLG